MESHYGVVMNMIAVVGLKRIFNFESTAVATWYAAAEWDGAMTFFTSNSLLEHFQLKAF